MRWLLVVAVVAAAPALARADDEDLGDKPTSVELAFAATNVRIKARFSFAVEGPGVALNWRSFQIPPDSVVTGGVAIVDGKRHVLPLVNAESASHAFDALTLKPGDSASRPWAFMVDEASGTVNVSVLAPRNAAVVLELTLDAPTCFHNDARWVALLDTWWERVAGADKKISATTQQLGEACGFDADEELRWIGKPSRDLAKQPAGERRLGVIAGRLDLSSTQLVRVEIDLARELTTVPADLHTVILLDHSRSMTSDELETQRAIALAYLRAAPLGRVQLIGFARHPQALLPSWMVASHAAPQVDRAIRALPPRNGSNIDDALTEAARWLRDVRGTKRIIVFSDERLASRFDEGSEVLARLLPAGTLVHVVHPSIGALGIERNDDQSVLPLLAKATQGMATFGAVDDKNQVDATILVRPISIDNVDVVAADLERVDRSLGQDCDTTLHEGMSCAWLGEGTGAAGPITITGLMWNTPIKRVVRADPTQARVLARLLSVTRILDPELQTQVDQVALAVNSVWSLFAKWGGDGGYEDVGGFGTIGVGRIGTSSHDHSIGTSGGRGTAPLDLRAQLQPAIDSCHAGEAEVAVSVETTLEEIVDVSVVVTPAVPAVASCITEAVWDTTLRVAGAPPRTMTRVAFGNKR
jgi:hypothetical protein